MTSHLTPEEFVGFVEGTMSELSASHLSSCTRCAEELAALRETGALVGEVGVPEPSPLFWDHLSARIREAVADERPPTPFRSFAWAKVHARDVWVAAVAAAVIAIAVGMQVRSRPEAPIPGAGEATSAVDAAYDVLGASDDASLSLVADLAQDLTWDAASDAGFTAHLDVDDDAVVQLTDGERTELRRLLKGELVRPSGS